ncbi:MAG: beta-N-acetylhexosaminidase [Cyclobacteriaceae bacterium]
MFHCAKKYSPNSTLTLGIISFFCLLACSDSKQASTEAKLAFESIIPKPISAQFSGNSFVLDNQTVIVTDSSGEEINALGNYLREKLNPATGFDLRVSTGDGKASGIIYLTTNAADKQLGAEGYALSITDDQIKISANKHAGLFYGIQTLRQLLSEKIEGSTVVSNGVWDIATGTIKDYPEYEWRGSMLDVARHFRTVEEVKRYTDLISFYKMNILHLHLSDDQGWRIEIKSWPNLTKIGGANEVGGGKGGFYTQEEYKEIVDYAKQHYITVIPEIDMPGHINAALVSYAELNQGPPITREAGARNVPGAGKPTPGVVHTGIEVGFSTLDIKKEVTFRFINDVLRELSAITPGPYLHIGGDEAQVTKKADYINFVNRFKEIVEANGKKMIGWEEIAQGDLDSTVIVQYWHSQKYALLAAEKGAKLIYSPSEKVYLDMQYDSTSKLGLHWAAYIEADSSYIWDPLTIVKGIHPRLILGVEAPLWSETLITMEDVEYMLFPRLPGVAEVGWTPAEKRDWNEYKVRLGNQSKRWKAMDINFYRSPRVPWVE